MAYEWEHSDPPTNPPAGSYVKIEGTKQYGSGHEDYYDLRGELSMEAVGGPGAGSAMDTVIAVWEALANEGFDVTFTSPTTGEWTLVDGED